jgi:hypothetical protein
MHDSRSQAAARSQGFASAAGTILDARTSPRVAADLPAQLYSRDFSGALQARTRDLSVSGACVAISSIISVGSLERIVLHLPDRSLMLSVQGRWQRDSPSEGSVLAGLSFERMESLAAGLLWQLVQQAGSELAQFLCKSAALQGLGPDDGIAIAQTSRFRRVAAGGILYQPTGPGESSIFIVREGQAGLYLRLAGSEELTLARPGPGELFGGFPAIAGAPNLETAMARSDLRLLEVSEGSFAYLRLARPILAQRLTQLIAGCYAQRVSRAFELIAASRSAARS